MESKGRALWCGSGWREAQRRGLGTAVVPRLRVQRLRLWRVGFGEEVASPRDCQAAEPVKVQPRRFFRTGRTGRTGRTECDSAVEDFGFGVGADADERGLGLDGHGLAKEGGERAGGLGHGDDGGAVGDAENGTGFAFKGDDIAGAESVRVHG